MLQEGDALIAWVWLDVEATNVVGQMNTEQCASRCSHRWHRSFRKRWEKLSNRSFVFSPFLNFVSTVVFQMCAEKRGREPKVSMLSAHLCSMTRVARAGEVARQSLE